MKTRRNRLGGLIALSCLLILPAGAPLLADADGLPHLDPTNGNTGTQYLFFMPEISRSLDPLTPGTQKVYSGTFTLLQDAGHADFDIVNMQVDTNGDLQPDRTLRCSGWNGFTRFGFRCSEDDGGAELNLLITGRAVRYLNGTIALRKGTGHGVTENTVLLVGFTATSY